MTLLTLNIGAEALEVSHLDGFAYLTATFDGFPLVKLRISPQDWALISQVGAGVSVIELVSQQSKAVGSMTPVRQPTSLSWPGNRD
jgi:hypothetical protein